MLRGQFHVFGGSRRLNIAAASLVAKLVFKAEARKSTHGDAPATTVFTINKRIDDVSMASVRMFDVLNGVAPAAFRRPARGSASQPGPFETPAARSGGRVRGILRVPQQDLQVSEARQSASAQ
jgi:hypothetical protein